MAGVDYHANSYIRRLNEYHVQLISAVELTCHLLDEARDADLPEWHVSGCFLMQGMLKQLAEVLPFPPEEMMVLESEVVGGAV